MIHQKSYFIQENSSTETKETLEVKIPADDKQKNPEENGDSSAIPDDSIIKSDEGNVGDNEGEEGDDDSEGEELPRN